MDLFYREIGAGKPLLILHGLYGSGDNWLTIAKLLENNHLVYLIDQRNHGKSPHDDEMNYNLLAEDLMIFVCRQALTKINILGHSMGGKVAMTFANKYPHLIENLIIADISPRTYLGKEEASPQALFHKNTIQSLLQLDIRSAMSREEIDQKLTHSIPQAQIRQFLLKNITRGSDGKFQWRINLPAVQENLNSLFGEVEILPVNPLDTFRVLFIKGANSNYITDDDRKIIPTYYSNFEMVSLPNAGHWLHAEYPDQFSEIVRQFLSKS